MTHEEKVLRHLQEHGEITSWDAIVEYGITRLSARIFNLRKMGHVIGSETITKKKGDSTVHYTRYTMER